MAEPLHIQWHITNLCNLRCAHCYQEDFSKERDLDWEGLKRVSDTIFATLSEWGQSACIHLTGGEPLLKPEWMSLLQYLDQSVHIEELGIITNGLLLTKEIAGKLSSFTKMKKMKISLDGASAETNDSIRGRGVFARTLQNIAMIKHEHRFEVILMFTVMKGNLAELPSFFKLSQELEIDGFIIERFIPWGRGRRRKDDVLGKEEWRQVHQVLSSLFSIDEESSFLPYQAFQVSFAGDEPELSGAPCVIGREGFCIMPDGDVFPCRRFPIPVGNLLETPLAQIWNESEILKKLRQKEILKGKCGRCDIKDCRGCRSLALALTGDYLGEDPHCWYPFSVAIR